MKRIWYGTVWESGEKQAKPGIPQKVEGLEDISEIKAGENP